VLLPLAAWAQGYDVSGGSSALTALPQPTIVSPNSVVTLPFSFQFFGNTLPSVVFTPFGYLTTSATPIPSGNNQPIPHSSASFSASLIAPWWDGLCPNATCSMQVLRYQVLTVAATGRRVIVFEWNNFGATNSAAAPRITFQAQLFEGTNEIRFAYGGSPVAGTSASIGVQRDLGVGVSAVGGASYAPGTMYRFETPSDLVISSLSMDAVGYAGVRFNATAQVANRGGRDATNTLVRYYLSTDSVLDVGSDPEIGVTATTTFFGASTTTVTTLPNARIPAGTAPGSYWVLSLVDPDNGSPESNENNNLGTPQGITVGSPLPDLITAGIVAPAAAMPGASIALDRTFSNVGNAPAGGAFKYTWFLSENSVVSLSDQVLGPSGQESDLQAMTSRGGTDMIMLPSGLAAGRYWVGACVNYDPQGTPQFGLTEISQINNCSQAPSPIVISTGQLSIITPAVLPQAVQHSPYGVRLAAAGGNGSYAWAPAAGTSLPAGLTFSASGDLQGTPSVAGTFSFDVTVNSGAVQQTQTFMLTVTPGNIPLSIVDQDLPAAEFGRAYEGRLLAVGGKPPYVWKLGPAGRLPSGLAVSTEGGIEGRANEAGDFTFSVELTDSAMTTVQKDLRLRVVTPASMHIATSRLRTAFLKQEYAQQLVAVGGRAPYTWSVLRFQRLPQNVTETPGVEGTDFPMGFGIFIDDGKTDFLRGEPKAAGLYAVTFRAVDDAGAEDFTTLLLEVSYTEPLTIVTTSLPDAFQGVPYGPTLSSNRERESTGLVYSVPCVQQAVRPTQFACAPVSPEQGLPPGVTLSSNGMFGGAPAATGSSDQVFSFLVKVTDDAGRQDIRSLSIRVRPNTAAAGSGCSAAPIAPLGLAALLLALSARRRCSSRSHRLR